MQDSLFKMFGSVRLVQEVTRSSQSTSSPLNSTTSHLLNEPTLPIPNSILVNVNTTITTTTSSTQTKDIHKKTSNISLDSNKVTPSCENLSTKLEKQNNQHMYIDLHESLKPSKTRRLSNLFLPTKFYTKRKYGVRHHRNRQSLDALLRKYQQHHEETKSKSQKLLCLWPLPIVTRYMILISLFISCLNWLNVLHLSSSAPSFVIHRLDFKNLLLAPFLFDFTLPSIALYGWNVLILGLFEESLTHMIGGTQRFITLLSSLFVLVLILRNALGFLFSKSTGWALPFLFFSNSMHEQSRGLSPFLFSLLVVQSLSIEDKYILIYDQENSNHKITIHKVTLQLIMCLVNYTKSNIYWWSLSGLLTGLIMTTVLQIVLAREKKEDSIKVKDMAEFISLEQYRRTPLWRLLWFTIQRACLVVGVTFMILKTWNGYYNYDIMVTPTELNTISNDPYLFTFIFMTAPRRGNPAYLTKTLESYLANWPEHPSFDSPYHRMQAVIYTHFTNHTQYDMAKEHFSKTIKGQRYLRWIREEGHDLNQRLHVSKALNLASTTFNSTYFAIMEDDFPVCGKNEWQEIENVIYKAEKNIQNHCGVFVGTGGSGLFLKPEITRLSSELLLKYSDMPPDIIIQKCLMGELDECLHCQDTLVTSKTLLMYHIGYNTSTSDDRVYKKDEFQCGWRHPFNGDPSVITL